MLFKNVASQKIHVYAYDSTTGAAKTGDANNITAYVSLDGTANAIDDTNPTEVDATNMPGVYVFDLAQAETNCNSFALYAKSSTSNIRIEPIIGFTTGAANSLSVNTGTITTGAITAAAIATDAIDADALAADAVTEIKSGLSTLTQAQVSGGAYDLTNATFVAAFKAALGTVPASGNWSTHSAADVKTAIEANGSYLDVLYDDWLNGGRLDLILDAIKATTDKLDTMVEVVP